MLLMCLLLVPGADETAELAKKMLPVYAAEAADYSLAVASDPKTALELKKEPVFEWSNPTRQGLQQGVVFVWLRDGRPAALASVFSQPHDKPTGRQIIHEFHALDPEKLVVGRSKGALNEWKPQTGLTRKELTGAPAPAATPAARLLQMRKLAGEFTAHSVDREMNRLELRLLPTPLYRYPAAKTGVTDGALFALVSTVGTDPEVLLLIEAKEEKGKVRWEYALGRFSDRDLYVKRGDKEVWSRVQSETNTFNNDPEHLYRLYADKVVGAGGKLLARVKVTPKVSWGEVLPVDEK
ncbi:Uncharacterized protein OS=Planctomyces maris DSM 8797 GN=PM8797T_23941 PE=4 SV=1 [Gemmata massiliana]|uniref:Uncharacterized protein n=1 Tax=Gemmata massiliana TaxID=1210884 RepID=A0A6P2D535_9BACT|nr:hypothetical protein [Gemmata massiliana]VTR96173.1 Uncharacterized protein OS=Planctomyces maris DSM 8797 GN=PM8797T_23941 PE=4 SV=1 [Gemmata massiliana]